ncbi:MAG: twin-arginine translocation signal domain-containing protein [Acidobacteriota bacterium]
MSRDTRRRFLQKASALPAAFASAAPPLPQIRLGRYSISRLICGSNTFNAGSHLSVFVNHEMRRYYTPEQILKTLRRCQEVGINCWQSGLGNLGLYRRLVEEGGKMHYLSLDAGDAASIQALAGGGCIGIAHHGEVTDRLFKKGALDEVGDYLKRVRDAGLLVGVSTHMPAVVDAIESKGWDLDYYMTCVYERHRTAAELEKQLGQAPIPVGEVYLPLDPPRMYKAMQQTKRPCLAFKILAAGRLSERAEWVERAFRETFAGSKPSDAVIVGMYDRYSDQPAQNAELARRYGSGPT